jgi:hypothetical protein
LFPALHIAVQLGHLASIRVLLVESQINAEKINLKSVFITSHSFLCYEPIFRGQNPLHMLGQYGRDNAAAIFELFVESMPEYPIDNPDPNGNTSKNYCNLPVLYDCKLEILLFTVLLLAYFNGNGALCRAVVRAGAALGTLNKEGFSIFNTPVATKQLLFKLLGAFNYYLCL